MKDALPFLDTDRDEVYFNPDVAVAQCPVWPRIARSKYGIELRGHDLVRDGFRNPSLEPRTVAYYEGLGATAIILEFIREGHLNFMGGEKHDRIRSIMVRALSHPLIEAFRPTMRTISHDLIDAFIDKGTCDLVGDFCHLLPITVLTRFIGVPREDVPAICNATVQLRMLGQVPFAPGIPALEAALSFLYDYVGKLLADRRAAPREDLVDALIALQAAGEKLSEKELIWGIAFMLLGGHDTTRFTLSGALHSLITNGLWEDIAAHPEQVPDAIAESMRYRAGTMRNMRLVREALEIEGVRLEPGDVISLSHAAAGRDPAQFEAPAEFRCQREKPGYQVGFGIGRHICAGQILAKAEMAEAVEIVTARLMDVRISGEVRVKSTGVVGGVDVLPVTFTRRQ